MVLDGIVLRIIHFCKNQNRNDFVPNRKSTVKK